MKKILGLTIAAFLIMAVVGGGTWAYFQDPETSTGNILSAGTLDLKTNNADGVNGTMLLQNMKAGDITGDKTWTLKNAGSINATTLDLVVSYVESDGTNGNMSDVDLSTNMSAIDFAKMLQVTKLMYGAVDLLTVNVVNGNGNGYKDIDDVKNTTLTGLAGLDANSSKDFVINVTLYDPASMDNAPQNDGVNITFLFTLTQ